MLRTTGAPRVAAVAIGLALTSCGFEAEPAYGVPDPSTSIGNESTAGPSTDSGATEGVTSTSGTSGTAGTSSGTADGSGTADTGATDGSDGSSSGGPEPAYGVPGTTTSG